MRNNVVFNKHSTLLKKTEDGHSFRILVERQKKKWDNFCRDWSLGIPAATILSLGLAWVVLIITILDVCDILYSTLFMERLMF
jgi:hypothetical protein